MGIVGLLALWMLRIPSVVQPMASDQGLYAYAGVRLLEGDAPYAGAWDQKPPGIHVVYAALWALWPDESVVAGADLMAAAVVALLLIVIGRRRLTEGIGCGAAAAFLFFGNPALTYRVGGIFARAQCETFIALVLAAALALAAAPRRTRTHLIAIGVLLGAAFWLKYNAAPYALTVLVALWAWRDDGLAPGRTWIEEVVAVGVAGLATVLVPLGLMAVAGATTDLYLATITYNAQYSGETYAGLGGLLQYAATFPIDRARNDALWFVGALGMVLTLGHLLRGMAPEWRAGALVCAAWLLGAWLSILINGGRGLPQYFVQAYPALALAAAVGLAPVVNAARARHVALAVAVMGVVTYGAHRASDFRGLAESLRADWAALTGQTPRAEYLARFGGRPSDKYVAGAIADLATLVRTTTAPSDTIYVFGWAPGVPVLTDRRSASRFHWSQPVLREFEAGRPGYGSEGLAADLLRERPALIALHFDSWAEGGRHSAQVFHERPVLNDVLTAHYTQEATIDRFEIWRRR